MDDMTSGDASVVPPARTWVTLLPFLLAVAVVAGVGGLVVFLRLRWNRLFKKKPLDGDPRP